MAWGLSSAFANLEASLAASAPLVDNVLKYKKIKIIKFEKIKIKLLNKKKNQLKSLFFKIILFYIF